MGGQAKKIKIICTGDRDWNNWQFVSRPLRNLLEDYKPEEITIVHGDATGADYIVDRVARSYGYTVLPYPANWKLYGNGAGPIRNRQMLDENKDTSLVLAFHDNLLGNSKGTLHMVRYAGTTKGIPVLVHNSQGKVFRFVSTTGSEMLVEC
jgi:hypothetical protein